MASPPSPSSRPPRRPPLRLALPALAALLVLALLPALLRAQPGGDRRQGREEELAAVRAKIGDLRSRVETIRSRESSLEKELALAEADLELQEVQLKEATQALAIASDDADAAQQRVERLKLDLDQARDDLRRSLTALYVLGRHGYWRLFLQLKADRNLLPSIRSLRFFILRDQQAIERVEAAEQALLAESAFLLARRREVETWHRGQAERRDTLAAAQKRRAEALARLNGERRRIAAEADLLSDKEIKLARFLNALVAGDQEPLRGKPIQDFRGLLEPPVDGEVTAPFGPRRDPRYRTEVPHHGIDFATRRGAKVQCIFPGEVIYAAHFEGYGPMVVIRHPGKVFTLSAGLDLLGVAKGDVLSLGDVVGTAADSLYFEIRVDNEPQDPAGWLR